MSEESNERFRNGVGKQLAFAREHNTVGVGAHQAERVEFRDFLQPRFEVSPKNPTVRAQ